MALSGKCILLGSVLSQQRFGVTDIKAFSMSQLSGLRQTVLQLSGLNGQCYSSQTNQCYSSMLQLYFIQIIPEKSIFKVQISSQSLPQIPKQELISPSSMFPQNFPCTLIIILITVCLIQLAQFCFSLWTVDLF